MTPVRVVIADDHPMFRYGLRAVLSASTDIVLVAEAGGGSELLAAVDTHRPGVVVTDLQMADLDGISATRQLLARDPTLAILVLTMHDDDEHVFAAMRAGARGYLLKGADRAELLATVLALSRGESVFGPSVARRITGFFLEAAQHYSSGTFPGLTPREREVLDRMATGDRNSAIAEALGISDKPVRNNVSNILSKLQTTDRTAAVVRARQAGLGRSHS